MAIKNKVIGAEVEFVIATLDACVLAPSYPRNILLSLADAKLFTPKWSNKILNETERAISEIVNDPIEGKKQRKNIEVAFPMANVKNFEHLINNLNLPDKDDIHVLATAKQSHSEILVTDNLKHFPADYLAQLQIKAESCDEFLSKIISTHEQGAFYAIEVMRTRMQKPAYTFDELITLTQKRKLPKTAKKMSLLKKYIDT